MKNDLPKNKNKEEEETPLANKNSMVSETCRFSVLNKRSMLIGHSIFSNQPTDQTFIHSIISDGQWISLKIFISN